jgi:hypothetical protein
MTGHDEALPAAAEKRKANTARSRAWRAANQEHYAAYNRAWNAAHRASKAEWMRTKRASDQAYYERDLVKNMARYYAKKRERFE